MPRRADHDGSVYFDQGRDKWVAAISLPNGKRIVRRLDSETEARATLSDLRTRYIAGTLVAPTAVTLPDWYTHWRDAKTLRPSSLQVYSMSVARVVAQIGNARLDRLTTPFIQAAFDDLAAAGMGSRNRQLAHLYLGACLKDAVRAKLIGMSPLVDVPKPSHQPKRKTYWSLEEARQFLVYARQDHLHWAPLFIVLATCGLRLAEAAGLVWGRVDLRLRTITVDRAVVRLNDGRHEGPPKTESAVRTLNLPTAAWQALTELQQRSPNTSPQALVFASGRGTWLTPQSVRVALQRACRRAGVPSVSPHGLRHVAAALAWAATHDVLAVQRRLGHANASTTMNIYAYLMRDDKKTADAVDFILGEDQPPNFDDQTSPPVRERPHPAWGPRSDLDQPGE